MNPLTAPAAAGEKPAFRFAVCPGARVVLPTTPASVKPAPATDTLEIVTFVLPLLVSVASSEPLPPSNTSPKLRLAALDVKTLIGVTAVTALAVAEIVSGEFGALLISDTDPVACPGAFGANTTLNVAYFPAAKVAGVVSPVMLKPVPVTVALEIVASAVPLLSTVIVCELLEPVATFAKRALLGLAESCAEGVFPGGVGVGVGVGALGFPAGGLEDLEDPLVAVATPAHPLIPSNANIAIAAANVAAAR
jgi:hypothetical protein